LRTNPLATLVVSERDTFRYLLFNDDLQLKGWVNEKTGELRPEGFSKPQLYRKYAFSGIQVLSPKVFELMNDFGERFSIMDFYLSVVRSQQMLGFVPENYQMIDVGKLASLIHAMVSTRCEQHHWHTTVLKLRRVRVTWVFWV